MKILCVGAHADDAEIWMGGTLIRHRQAGDEISIATFPNGDCQRMAEAQAGSGVIGARLYFLNGSVDDQEQQCRQELQHLLEHIRPEIVITHWAGDTHPHHRFVFELVNSAIIPVRIEMGRPRALFVCDTYHSVGLTQVFSPHIFVDVTDVWGQKLQAIECHTSQSPSLWKEMITNQAKLHGARIGTPYAEAFMEVPILGRWLPRTHLPTV